MTAPATAPAFNVHRNYSPDWSTPPEWLDWVSRTFGHARWFDPCPEIPEADGLSLAWRGDTYTNPPGSNATRSVNEWWQHGHRELQVRSVDRLIWCFFNMETTFSVTPSPWTLPGYMVMPRPRVAFIDQRTGTRQKSPRNRTWFWCHRVEPAMTPVPSLVVPTGVGWTPTL